MNNHIGVPLTLLAMTRDVEFGIVEMGASACGEIALLCSIAEPNYGIVQGNPDFADSKFFHKNVCTY